MVRVRQRLNVSMVIVRRLRSTHDSSYCRHDTRDKRHTRLRVCCAPYPRLERVERLEPMELYNNRNGNVRTNASAVAYILQHVPTLRANTLRRLHHGSTSHVDQPLVLEIARPSDIPFGAERSSS
jgi:hypothetical protein